MRVSQSRSKSCRLALVGLVWLAAVCPLPAEVTVTQPFRGVTHFRVVESQPRPLCLHVVEVDLRAPGVRFKLSPPGGSLDTIRQSTLDFLRQEKAQVAINAHFMLPFPSADTNAAVVGFAASEGRVFSTFEPQPIGPQYLDQSYAILPYAPALNIDPSNQVDLVPAFPAQPKTPLLAQSVRFWNALAGSAQIVTEGRPSIPRYTGAPGGLNPVAGYSEENSWYRRTRARTAIGFTQDRQTLVLFVVEESPRSLGMTLEEVADWLIREHRVYAALNLDGGGSTTLAMEDPVSREATLANLPSGGPTGRAVGTSLAVFAEPVHGSPFAPSVEFVTPDQVRFAWPSASPGWRLQHNTGLHPSGWVDVRVTPVAQGPLLRVTLPAFDYSGFYRLAR